MTNRTAFVLSFTSALAVCAAVMVLLDQPGKELDGPVPAEPGQRLGATLCFREHAAVLSWIFEQRPEATKLELLAWSAPSQVSDNPFSHGPATLVTLIVKDTASASLEQLSFYLRDLDVLGSIIQPYESLKAAVCV
jgi:hypothetical protein